MEHVVCQSTREDRAMDYYATTEQLAERDDMAALIALDMLAHDDNDDTGE